MKSKLNVCPINKIYLIWSILTVFFLRTNSYLCTFIFKYCKANKKPTNYDTTIHTYDNTLHIYLLSREST
jgi:hypothetical protein